MNPMFFGPQGSLYGVHHPPRGDVPGTRDSGIVLCNPFGQEYMRAHRAYRQLALLLTRKGFHVLRFDYRGTGDSAGDMTNMTATDWQQDTLAAVEELREASGVRSIGVLGLRLGALIAGYVCNGRDDIDRLILWDPIVSGAAYDTELRAEITAEKPNPYSAHSGNAEMPDGTLYYNGFPMHRAFRDSLRALDLGATSTHGIDKVLLAVSHETPEFVGLRDGLRAHVGFHYRYTPAPHDWNYVDNFGGILLPQPVIQAIVNWTDAEARS